MPLSEKVRIEIYLPDMPEQQVYHVLLESLRQELAFGFGGCTLLRGLEGSYRAQSGTIVPDRVNLLYTDIPYSLEQHLGTVSRYTDAIRAAVFEALDEEAVLVVAHKVHWSQ